MRPIFTLGPRLQKCADFVRPGAFLADIGTDHGYLPIWLLKQGLVRAALAADVNPRPLAAARANAQKYGVDLACVLSDGLGAVPQEAAQDIVVAGMGGELIAQIVQAAPWARQSHLVLQPMSAAEKLRAFLFSAGLAIAREEAVVENGKCYSVLSVFAGQDPQKDVYMGAIAPGSENSAGYAQKVARQLRARARGPQGAFFANKAQEIEKRFL